MEFLDFQIAEIRSVQSLDLNGFRRQVKPRSDNSAQAGYFGINISSHSIALNRDTKLKGLFHAIDIGYRKILPPKMQFFGLYAGYAP